jgi:hypothetical protein
MIALADAPPSPKAETDQRKSDENDYPVILLPAVPEPSSAQGRGVPPSFAGTINQLFREVKRAVTGKACPAPKPKRRRRSGEVWASFRMAARKIMRSMASLPAWAYIALASDNPLDPLNPYWSNPAVTDEQTADIHTSEQNHLFPQL